MSAIEELGRELDAIRDEVMESRGERDRRYILRLIAIQRGLALGGRIVIFASLALLARMGPRAGGLDRRSWRSSGSAR